MTALPRTELGPFTLPDWDSLPAREDGSRLELIEGYWHLTPPPSGQHQAASLEVLVALRSAIRHSEREDLYVVGGVGVKISTVGRTALIPDILILNTRPIGNAFTPDNVLLAGEIWSPGNTNVEQRDKFNAFATAGIPYFWSIAQDHGGPVELAAYRLHNGQYLCDTTTKLDSGPTTITASPIPTTINISDLRT